MIANVAMPFPAFADPASGDVAATVADDTPALPPSRVGYGAMPGGVHVPTAESLPAGSVELAALSAYGYRKGLLSADHTLKRALGQLAVGYAPVPHLTFGISLDGRYDKHDSFQGGTDDGYVGDPHVLVRYARPVGRVMLGGQLNLWVPGKDAPSVALAATSIDARGLLTIDAGFGTLSLDAGFRLDNSAKSVDDPSKLSEPDEVSLGVSSFHAVVAGGSLRVPFGRAYGELEGSTEMFVGSRAPGPIIRGAGMVGVALSDAVSLIGFVEVAHVPAVTASAVVAHAIPLIPYEPLVTGGLGIQARFGGRPARAAAEGHVIVNRKPVPVTVAQTADVSGIVFDDTGKPVVAATVTIKLKNHTGTAVTDGKGAYAIAKLPIGKTVDGKTELDDTGAEVSAEVANKKPGSVTLTLTTGANAVPPITLESILPPGQLRAVIINVGTSRPVAGASVTIEPGGVTATSGPDGKFTVDLPPGRYKLTVTARGLAKQQLDVNIEQNGVAIKNIELHK
jgi:hypothetical protein